MANSQCFSCGEVGHRFYQCPRRKRASKDTKDDPKASDESKGNLLSDWFQIWLESKGQMQLSSCVEHGER